MGSAAHLGVHSVEAVVADGAPHAPPADLEPAARRTGASAAEAQGRVGRQAARPRRGPAGAGAAGVGHPLEVGRRRDRDDWLGHVVTGEGPEYDR